MATSNVPLTGSCNCGGVLITLRQSPTKVSLCHCLGCRASGGSLFAVNLLVPSVYVDVSGSVTPKVYTSKAASGNHSNRHFCPECGSPTHTTVSENPSMTFVKGGLFRSSGYALEEPFKEQWWRRAEVWERPYVSDEAVID